MAAEIKAIHGDITKLEVDVIVNAANVTLLGGVGVDGAIHAAAGPQLLEECRGLGGCEPGQAKITKGYQLLARYVIHTVGPVYGEEDGEEDVLLADCYRRSLELAQKYNLKTIAFPNISTGIFRYPKDEAAEIAIKTTKRFLEDNSDTCLEQIIFVSFTEPDFKIFKQEFDQLKDQ